MRKNLLTLFVIFAVALTGFSQSENPFKVDIIYNTRSDFGLGYNFFVGDAEDFRTTIRGFGSGFLFDLFSGRYSADIVQIGWDNANVSLGLGATITKYRLSEPLRFYEENGVYGYVRDDVVNPEHDYGDGFFSDDKSKLVMATLIFPVNFNFDFGDFDISAGGTMDVYLTGKHKLKYHEDGDKEKEVIKNNDFNDYPLSKLKWGLGFMAAHEPTGVSLAVTYMLTPFFKDVPESTYPEIREMRVSLSYDLEKKGREKYMEKKEGNDL